jgi:hypothetical protein
MNHRADNLVSVESPYSTNASPERTSLSGSMAGTVRELGGIVGPSWTDGPSDVELGIAYRGKNGPVYWVDGDFTEEEA